MDEYYIYLRKSRADSPLESVEEVLARHETMLQDLAVKKLGYRIREDHILREVVSGETIIERPKMIELLRIIESDNVKAVLAIEPQRLTRGDLEDCGKVENAFRYSNTRIITLQMEYDLSNKMQRKFFEQELMRGNDYLEYTKEILWRGRVLSAQKGNFIGSIPPYGYDKTKDEIGPTLKENELSWVVTTIGNMYYYDYKTFLQIALYLDSIGVKPARGEKWNKSSIKSILKNPHYAGYVRFGYMREETVFENGKLKKICVKADKEDVVYVPGRQPVLIPPDVFAGIQERINNNPRAKIDAPLRNPLAGILYCAKCGKMMVQHPYKKARQRIECRTKHYCDTKSTFLDDLVVNVAEGLKNEIPELEEKLKNKDSDAAYIQERQLQKMDDELRSLSEQEKKQYDLLEKGIYSEEIFIERNHAIRNEMDELRGKIDALKATSPKRIDYADKIVKLKAVIAALEDDTMTPEEQNRVVKAIVKRIGYNYIGYGGKGKVKYTLNIELLT